MGTKKRSAADKGTERKKLRLNKETVKDLAVPNRSEREVQGGVKYVSQRYNGQTQCI